MKNLVLKSVVSLFVSILFFTNGQAQNNQKVKGSGKVVNETRNVGTFDKVGVSGSFDVFLVKGNEGKIDLKIEDNLSRYLVTEVSDGKLKIKWKKGTNVNTRKNVVITVYFNDINGVGLSGSGDIVGKDLIKASDFSVAVSGSGDVDLEVESNTLKASVSGSGDLVLKGKVNMFSASVAGSGDISAYELSAEKADLKVSGSGGVNLTAHHEIKARVAGSGDVKYKGNPKITDVKVSGSGNIGAH